MPKLQDWIIERVYRCTNCEGMMLYEDKASRNFRKKCPFCKKHDLVIQSGLSGLSIGIDTSKRKTLVEIGEENIKRRDEEAGVPKQPEMPFWRSKKKVDFKVLQNPKKYIETGRI